MEDGMSYLLVRVSQRMTARAVVLVCVGVASTATALALPAAALASTPTVGGDPPSLITSVGATLNALVNPEGELTQVHFDYDQDSSTWCQHGGALGSPANSTTPAPLGFTDNTGHVASAAITGLTPNTGYCFEAVASNTDGPTTGAMSGFTTLAAPPVVSTGSASSITGIGATLSGTVNPEGQSTSYQFDYDYTRDAWCQSAGASGTPAGHTTATPLAFTDSTAHQVSATITGFTPGDSICFAVVASNAPDTAAGATVTFSTTALVLSTGSASSVINGGATLHGSINPEDQPTTSYYFAYGPVGGGFCGSGGTATFDESTTAITSLGFTDSTDHPVSAAVTALTPSTAYCVRLVEFNASFIFADAAFAPTFTTPPPVTLTVNVTGNGEADTAHSGAPDSITCGGVTPQVPIGAAADCVGTYVQGSVVTLTETPYTLGGEESGDARRAAAASPVSFSGWSGACSGTGPTCTVTMSVDKTVGATFTGTGPASSGPSGPSAAAVNAAVNASLKVTASIAAILKAGGFQTKVSFLVPGTLTITWNTGSGTHGTRSVVVASGSKTVGKTGVTALKIKLTKAGRALLKRSKHLKLTVSGSFKPKQGKTVAKHRTITLTG
jgi:hypothetical protein